MRNAGSHCAWAQKLECLFNGGPESPRVLDKSRGACGQASLAAGGIGIGAQAWGLAAKLREMDLAISPDTQTFVFEVHPEVCFWAMNSGSPMKHSKKSAPGETERIAVLQQAGTPPAFLTRQLERLSSGRDDFLDACSAAWTARRIALGKAARMPAEPTRDSRGLDMAIWY